MKLYLIIPLLSTLLGGIFTAKAMENPPAPASSVPSLKALAARPLYRKIIDDQDFKKAIQSKVQKIPTDVKSIINNADHEMMESLKAFIANHRNLDPNTIQIRDLSTEHNLYSSQYSSLIDGHEILIAALEQKRQDIVRLLAHAGTPPAKFHTSLRALFKLPRNEHSLIKTFLDYNVVSLKDKYDNWPLICVAAQVTTHPSQPCKATDIFITLLTLGCDPNAREDLTGKTPLMLLCETGCAPCARELIKKGAQLEATDDEGKTAAVYAVKNNKVDAFRVLIEHKANTDVMYGDKTLFDYAKSQRHSEILRVLRIAKEEKK